MTDTYFYIPASKASRLVPILTKSDQSWSFFSSQFNANYPIEGAKTSYFGGCGLNSTISDYANFLSIFINDGRYKNKQILSKSTLKLLKKNQLNSIENLAHGLVSGIVSEKDLKKGGQGSQSTLYWGGLFQHTIFC